MSLAVAVAAHRAQLQAYPLIGGHAGMEVYRLPGGIIEKVALDAHNRRALQNDIRFLDEMAGSGMTPTPRVGVVREHEGKAYAFQSNDLGRSDHHPLDGELFRRNMIRLLWELRSRNVRHGDMTSSNIILKRDWPYLIDFQEAHFIGEPAPQKQPWSDSGLCFRTIAEWPADGQEAGDTPRVARRWRAVLRDLGAHTDLALPLKGKTFCDLGCFQGDFVAAAACEGMRASGIDTGGFHTGENSIAIARELWSYMPVKFDQANIMDLDTFNFDVVLLFSTFAYMVRDYGRAAAEAKLMEIAQDCGILYFETQLAGDGPGPAWLPSDEAVQSWLNGLGCEAAPIVTIPVVGRRASRTVWRVAHG